jgi:ribosomal protein S12 methylthiotransferase accessory factor
VEGSSTKRYRKGTHRTKEPGETLQGLLSLTFECGITRVADVTGLDCIGIPTVVVVRPNASSLSVCQGRGADLAAAKVSGIMAALELHHAEHIQRALRFASAFELRGPVRVFDIERALPSRTLCTSRDRIFWTEGRTFDTGEPIWVPLELVHLDQRAPGSGYFAAGSHGLASGNTLDEAAVHGICELIEQDALTLFSQRSASEKQQRQLDPSTIDDAVCLELLSFFATAEMRVALWDLTTDVGVPCFLCWVLDDSPVAYKPIGVTRGSGCHPSRAVALWRALTEAAGRRLTQIVGTQDDVASLAELPLPAADEQRAAFHTQLAAGSYREAPTIEGTTIDQDITWLRQKLEMVQVSMAIVDLSTPNWPVHVVRAVATGLEASAELPQYKPGARAQRMAAARGAA